MSARLLASRLLLAAADVPYAAAHRFRVTTIRMAHRLLDRIDGAALMTEGRLRRLGIGVRDCSCTSNAGWSCSGRTDFDRIDGACPCRCHWGAR